MEVPRYPAALGLPDLVQFLLRLFALYRRSEHVGDGLQEVHVVLREGPAAPGVCSQNSEGSLSTRDRGGHGAYHPVLAQYWSRGKARLLEKSPVEEQERAANGGGVLGAIMGGQDGQEAILEGMDPQHMIVNGLGSGARDSAGNPWTAAYITASNNLLADLRFNVTAESQGRLQVARLYELTDDSGVRDMLAFMLARDTMHQNQWLAAIEEVEADGLEETPVPSTFPQEREHTEVSYQFWNCSEGEESKEGRWASGPSPDGKGEFEYLTDPGPRSQESGDLAEVDPRIHGTPKQPKPPVAS